MWLQYLHINLPVRSGDVGIETFMIVRCILTDKDTSVFARPLLRIPVVCIAISGNENRKGENEEKNGRGTLNRQAAVTIATGKLYPNCQNVISSVSIGDRKS